MSRVDAVAPIIRAIGADDGTAHPDRLAAKMLDILRECSRDEQMAVLLACAEEYPSAIHDERHRRATAALRASRELDPKVTVESYKQWRQLQDDPGAYPSPSQIVRLFGGWADALSWAGLRGAGDPRAERAVSAGRRFTEEQILELLRRWAGAVEGLLLERDFLEWCREQSRLWQPGDPLHPRTAAVLQRLGGWHHLLAKAGLAERGSSATYVSKKPWRYSDETMLMWTRRIADSVDGPVTMAAYDAERTRRRAEAHADGRELSIPFSVTLCNRFGSWLEVLAAAGLSHRTSIGDARSTAPYRPSELVSAVRRAANECGLPLPRPVYDMWRDQHMGRTGERVPHSSLVAKKLGGGSWDVAVDVVVHGAPVPMTATEARSDRTSVTRADCLLAVREALEECGAPLSRERYSMWHEGEEASGRSRPHYALIARKLGGGSWVAALMIASGDSSTHLPGGHQASGRRYGEREARGALLEAVADLGEGLTFADYVRWRERRLAEMRRVDPLARLASGSVIKRTLGGEAWSRAVIAVLDDTGTQKIEEVAPW